MIARRWLVWLSLAVVLVLFGAGIVAGSSGTDDGSFGQSGQDDLLVPQTEGVPNPDATVTRISVEPNGTARWSLTIRMRLDSNESVEGFGAFEEEFRTNRSQYLDRFRDRMTGVVDNAETVTDREMSASAFDAEVGIEEVPRRWGYVTYQFRWRGFAAVEDGVTAGDVFQGGLFLEDDDVLILDAPAGYEPDSVDPTPDETNGGTLQWNGPVSFDDRRPQVRFVSDDSTSSGADSGSGSSLPLLVGLAVVVLLGLAAAFILRRDSTDSSPAEQGALAGGDSAGGTVSAESDPVHATDELELGSLATDEDRVLSLLSAEGGRMRQADIADRLDWSASKTSRVISEMADDGIIEKLRIGRENVIDLTDGEDTDD